MGYIGIASSESGKEKYQLLIKVDKGMEVVVSNSTYTKKFREKNNLVTVSRLPAGTWNITARLGEYEKYETVSVSGDNDRKILYMNKNMVPQFTSKGLLYSICNDADFELNEFVGTSGDWRLKFVGHASGTSGTVTFTNMHGQKVDIFLVGGGGNGTTSFPGWGGSGGGGGYTKTIKGIMLKENVSYTVVIGGACGKSSFVASDGSLNLSVKGGKSASKTGDNVYGGDGGSGGGAGHGRYIELVPAGKSGSGGSDGNNGGNSNNGYWDSYTSTHTGGKGQRNLNKPSGETGTTYEFGEDERLLYSSGGAGGSTVSGYKGSPGDGFRKDNSGAGGNAEELGFSGVIIIRNARED